MADLSCKLWLQNLFAPLGTQLTEAQADALFDRLRRPSNAAGSFWPTAHGEIWLAESDIVAVLAGPLPMTDQEWLFCFRNNQPGPTRTLAVPALPGVGPAIKKSLEQHGQDNRAYFFTYHQPGGYYLAIHLHELVLAELRPFQPPPPAPAPGGQPPPKPAGPA